MSLLEIYLHGMLVTGFLLFLITLLKGDISTNINNQKFGSVQTACLVMLLWPALVALLVLFILLVAQGVIKGAISRVTRWIRNRQ